jgi:hypothetical protein
MPLVGPPQLAYKFGELVEVHAADTYAEFVEANEVRAVTGQHNWHSRPVQMHIVRRCVEHLSRVMLHPFNCRPC